MHSGEAINCNGFFESKPLVFLAQLMYIVTAIKEYEDTYIFIYKTGTYFVIIFKWAF